MYRLYVFHPGKHLVNAVPLRDQKDVEHVEKWIKKYQETYEVYLIRAILGPHELVVLKSDEKLRIPGAEYAKPTAKVRS